MAWTITVDQGFNETYYLNAKAAQMGNGATAATALQAIQAAGMTAAQHYSLYGYKEGLAPNAYFSYSQYSNSKAAQMGNGATAATFELAWFQSSGSTNVYQHYAQYGAFETGVEPSTGFNDDQYYTAKAAQMGGTTTPAQAKAAIQAAGLNPISHYALYGKNESLNFVATPVDNPGQTFTLTTNQDNVTSQYNLITGVLNDTINTSTLQVSDTINAAAGTVLNLVSAGTLASAVIGVGTTPVLNGVATLNYTEANAAAGANALLGLTPDLTTINDVGSVQNTAFTGVGTAVKTLGFTNNVTACTDTLTYQAGLTASTDTLTINASGSQVTGGTAAVSATVSGAAAGDGFDIVNVNSTGSASNFGGLVVDDGTNATMTTLNIVGGANFTVDGSVAALDFKGSTGTVNASTATGAINLTFGTEDNTVTGGSGNDRFAFFAAGDLTTADVLDGGTGTNTLAIADIAVNSTSTALNNAITAAKNFSTLEFNTAAGGATLDVSKVSAIKDYNFKTTGAITVTNAQDDVFTITDNVAGVTSIAPKAGTTAANLNLNATTALAGTTGLTLTGFSTVNVASNGLSSLGATVTGAVTNSTGATINVTGNHSLTIASLSLAGTINASTFTGKLVATGSTVDDTIIGGAKDDTLKGDTGDDALTGGAGNDTITGDAGMDVIDGGTGHNTYIIATGDSDLTGMGAVAVSTTTLAASGSNYDSYTITSGDTFTTGVAGVTAGTSSIIDNGTTAMTVGTSVFANAGDVIYWNDGSNTYVAESQGIAGAKLAATDDILVISGVHAITGTATTGTGWSLTAS